MTIVERLPDLPPRPADAHKGSFGRVLIVAGSPGMSGAAVLAGLGALRGGAGLVYIAAPASIIPIVAASEPSYLTIPLPANAAGAISGRARALLLERAESMTAAAIGPGLGTSHGAARVVGTLLRRLPIPMVVDADALNLLAEDLSLLSPGTGPRILTPHPGEFARLTGLDIAAIQSRRTETAMQFAAEHGVIVLLKGAGTVITDGEQVAMNPTGNPGLATGGTGDVLTGLIAALLAQGLAPFAAAQLGAWLHGRAGDLAAAEHSCPGLIASDLPRSLGRAWLEARAGTSAGSSGAQKFDRNSVEFR